MTRSVGYSSAGTVEFLLDEDGSFYFLEVNTRLQVEHAITEMVTGLDLVHWQIRIARGERLSAQTIDAGRLLVPRGHSIECRVYAEDPDNQFLPSPGRILDLREPAGPGVRNDSGIEAGFDVPMFYDPMLAKLVVWGEDRAAAIGRLRRALGEYHVAGIRTTLPFFRWLLEQPEFADGPVPHDVPGRGAAGAERPAVRRSAAGRGGDCRHRGGPPCRPVAHVIGRPIGRHTTVEGSGSRRRTARLTRVRSRNVL